MLNFETVQYFNAHDHERERYEKTLHLYKEAQMKMAYSMRIMHLAQSITITGGMTASLMLAYNKIKSEQLTLGDFVVFQIYIQQLVQPLI